MNSKIKSEDVGEIDLYKAAIVIWKGKMKIITITAIAIIVMLGIQSNQKPEKLLYLATTEIRPISTFDEFEYETYNLYFKNLGLKNLFTDKKFFSNSSESKMDNQKSQNENLELSVGSYANIERRFLINLFIEKLSDYSLFKKLIIELNFLNQKNYPNKQEFEEAVTKLAASIKLLPPNLDEDKGKIEKYWRIEFLTGDLKKWKTFLEKIEKPTNNEVRLYLTKSFKKFIKNERVLKEFAIEDINMQINDSLTNYEIKATRRILYLKEQAKIARELDVAKNNFLESQSFKTESAVITNIISDIPYYMKGYEMIEKEIELIQQRNDKKAFTDNLNTLEQELRMLNSDKVLERLETLFEKTPILKKDIFYAAKLMTQTSKYSNVNKEAKSLMTMLSLGGLLGAIIGIFYVFMSNAIRNHN